jgi:glycosyltransferase involved in cell wall biosynthesis
VAVSSLRARLGLASDQGWIASLGTLEPRKNAPALIRGWIKAALRRAKPPALVLAGASGWDEQVAAAVGAVPSALRLVRPGYLPAGDLSALLGGADVVAYPSLGEGFGLPVLEAMACGAPVLTTRRLALPEIGGDAVLYTEPTDHGIAAALTTLLDDPARRRRLAAAGLTRSALFSWDACAQAHISAYEAASARARRG